ncbi:MAG TPA: histidine phosphatase family protein [Tianweitania sediminis]|nr:histidine phosphatase family protein [Tianweitania sediminis]
MFRHAKAQFAASGMRDFDRPLEPRGLDDARAMGATLSEQNLLPEKVICSTGLRARQTWEAAQTKLPAVDTEWTDALYNADAAGYLQLVHQAQAASSLMLVGHNPMMEDLALALAQPNDPKADEMRRSGFPTAGLAILEFEGTLEGIETGKGRVVHFLKPQGR